MHVREKFPWAKGNEPLVRKLGRANAQRRKWLESRRQGCESPLYQSHLDSKALKTYANYQKDSSSSTATTTRATATDSGGSSSMKMDEDEPESLVPEPPSDLTSGRRFRCPYCYIQVEISNTPEWQRHVFADLSSYTCTFDSCPAPLFETRQQWFQHEMEVHRKHWQCDIGSMPSDWELTPQAFGNHLAKHLEELSLFVLPPTTAND
ncbi:hypothetical protein B0H65DRAFT_502515, partial [Neurospora tetraspora]